MNPARVAKLFRELAAEFEQGADEPAVPAKGAPRRRTYPVPAGEVDDVTRARARRAMAQTGMVETTKR